MKTISLYRADMRGEKPDAVYDGWRDRLRLAWAVFVGRCDVLEVTMPQCPRYEEFISGLGSDDAVVTLMEVRR